MSPPTLFFRNVARTVQVRFGSSGATEVYSTKWVRAIRGESNILTAEDPPTAPLSHDHDVNDGSSDFSNWVDRHQDVSAREALIGVSCGFAILYGMYRLAVYDRNHKTPEFTLRQHPTLNNDIPTMSSEHFSSRKPE